MNLQSKQNKEAGTVSVEYALMISLVALALIVTMAGLADEIQQLFNKIGSRIGSTTANTTLFPEGNEGADTGS